MSTINPTAAEVYYSLLNKGERVDSGRSLLHSKPWKYAILQRPNGHVFVIEETSIMNSSSSVVWEMNIMTDLQQQESKTYFAKLQGDCNFVIKQVTPIKKTYWDSKTSQYPNIETACSLLIFPEANPPRIAIYKGLPPYDDRNNNELWWEPLLKS